MGRVSGAAMLAVMVLATTGMASAIDTTPGSDAACRAQGLRPGTAAYDQCRAPLMQQQQPVAQNGHIVENFDFDRYSSPLNTSEPGGCVTFSYSTSGPGYDPITHSNMTCR